MMTNIVNPAKAIEEKIYLKNKQKLKKIIKQNFNKEKIISKKNKMILKMLNRAIYATKSTTMKISQ